MEIPPDKMHLLDDTSRVGNPIILAGILGPDLYHTFSSFQASFGKAAFQGSGEDSHVYLTQESSRQDNASPVVISFRVPTWILSNNPRDTSVFVGIQSTPETARQWASNLGLNMRLFAAKLMDTEYVHVVPLTAEGQTFLSTPSVYAGKEAPLTVSDTTTSLVIDEAGKSIKYVKIRSDISGKAKDELARVETDISVEQARQTGLNLKIGSSLIQKLETPFLVDASRSKLRVSRKSSWVDSNLDRLPTLDISKAESIQWMNPHVSLMMSDRERTLRGQGIQGSDALVISNWTGYLEVPGKNGIGADDLSTSTDNTVIGNGVLIRIIEGPRKWFKFAVDEG
ncbi:hypothetical protein PHLCEN_2v4181, partial [Hermanssonia centrifuga]